MNGLRGKTEAVNSKEGKKSTRLSSYMRRSARIFASLIFVLTLPHIAESATFAVTRNATQDMEDVNLVDDLCGTAAGTCTLRAAIQQSNVTSGEDLINLPAGNYVLALGTLVIEDDLTIRGEGAGTITSTGTITDGTIIDGDGKSGVILIGGQDLLPPTVNILRVTIQNGISNSGAGILVLKGRTLSLTHSIINRNLATSGGGIFNEGTLTVAGSTITNNSSDLRGGGGILNRHGTVTLIGSTIDNNQAVGGGFTGGGGIEHFGGTLTITNSTISGNQVTGGFRSKGGGIRNAVGATLNLTNVTIANNRVVIGSGAARRGGGIFNEASSTVNLTNTIISGNNAGTAGPDCFGELTSGGFNLIGNTTGNISGSANLASLADYGGPTQTHALSFDSPAIDNGTGVTGACPDTDQRGFARPVDGDGDGTADCDIGAFEVGAVPPVT